MTGQKFTGTSGLPLARRAVRILKDGGIYAHSLLSVGGQELAMRYVIRGLESGGSVGDVGRYVTFTDEVGEPLEYLHPIETIAVNGLHAVVISNAMLRADMLRKGRTYESLITRHCLSLGTDGAKPWLECEIVFRGIHRRLELDLTGRDKAQAGRVVPTFYSLAGEENVTPAKLPALVRAATRGVNCRGCSHTHYLRKPCPFGRTKPNDSIRAKLLTGRFRRPWCIASRRCIVPAKIKQVALIGCLFLFLFVVIGGDLHLNPGAAFLAAATATLLVMYLFYRRCFPKKFDRDRIRSSRSPGLPRGIAEEQASRPSARETETAVRQ